MTIDERILRLEKAVVSMAEHLAFACRCIADPEDSTGSVVTSLDAAAEGLDQLAIDLSNSASAD